MAAIGGALDLAGTLWGAGAKADRKRKVKELSAFPALDIAGISSEAQRAQLESLPLASQIALGASRANQEALTAAEEIALPGAQAARARSLSEALGFLDDDKSFLEGVARRGAALGIGRFGGGAGSSASQIGTLRLSDLESRQRKIQGVGLLQSLLSSLRIADSPGIQAFMAPQTSAWLAQRASEAEQRRQLQLMAIGMPGYNEIVADRMQQVGGSIMGIGAGGASQTGWGFGGAGGSNRSNAFSTPPAGTLTGAQSSTYNPYAAIPGGWF